MLDRVNMMAAMR